GRAGQDRWLHVGLSVGPAAGLTSTLLNARFTGTQLRLVTRGRDCPAALGHTLDLGGAMPRRSLAVVVGVAVALGGVTAATARPGHVHHRRPTRGRRAGGSPTTPIK